MPADPTPDSTNPDTPGERVRTRVPEPVPDRGPGNAPQEASTRLRVTALAGGIGGARFLRGLLAHLERTGTPADVTVIGNTGDDVTLHGLRVCPDLDTVMYTLGGGIHEGQGWGRDGETFSAAEELAAYGRGPAWFTLGDRDLATHVVRTELLRSGMPLSEVTALLCARWRPGVRLLPMSDDVVETHVDLEDGRVVHFQEWWVGLHASVPARRIVPVGAADASPAPGVLEAIGGCDVVLLPPSNPVVSIGTVLAVPGIREALRDTGAPVVGVSPIIGGAPVRGMADACLTAIGEETTARAVAGLYADFLDTWLVADGDGWASDRPRVVERPLLMSDPDAAAALAGAALAEGLALAGAAS
jgi:LPPG:FO 2-phospho-L-lactate transferase